MLPLSNITVEIPRFRAKYQILRESLNPKGACDHLAHSFECSIEFARRIVSQQQEIRICKVCWEEYIHDRKDKRHICPNCISDQRNMEYLHMYEDEFWLRLFPRKFVNDEETVAKTMAMLTTEYGMTPDEALYYIDNVRDANQIYVRAEANE